MIKVNYVYMYVFVLTLSQDKNYTNKQQRIIEYKTILLQSEITKIPLKRYCIGNKVSCSYI